MEPKKLTFTLVFTQTRNFAFNRIKSIALVSFVLALFNSMTISYLYHDNKSLQSQFSVNPNDYFLFIIIALLITIVMKSISIATVYNLYTSDKINLNLLLSKMLSTTLKIALFYLLIAIFILIFSMLFTLLAFCLALLLPNPLNYILIGLLLIVPIVFLFIFFNFFYGTLVGSNQNNVFDLILSSFNLSKRYWAPILIMLLINILFVVLLNLLEKGFGNDNIVLNFILTFFSVFFDIFLTAFFYRFYLLDMNATNPNLATQNEHEDSNNLLV